MLSDWVHGRFTLPEHDLIDCKKGCDPERQATRFGSIGVSASGLCRTSFTCWRRKVSACSRWPRSLCGSEALRLFLNTTKTAERSRFDAVHELGHLVLHRHGGLHGGREVEDQANQFASAFLMPKADVRARLPRVGTLGEIVAAKKRWRVSVAALNYRLHKLGITTDWQYRTFCIRIIQNYKQAEPEGSGCSGSLVVSQ